MKVGFSMKKFLLASIAALFLATGCTATIPAEYRGIWCKINPSHPYYLLMGTDRESVADTKDICIEVAARRLDVWSEHAPLDGDYYCDLVSVTPTEGPFPRDVIEINCRYKGDQAGTIISGPWWTSQGFHSENYQRNQRLYLPEPMIDTDVWPPQREIYGDDDCGPASPPEEGCK
jgi:hypothetical protein